MKKFTFSLFLLLVFAAAMFGQETPRGVCGTSFEDQMLMRQMNAALEPGTFERGAIQYVPIHFHLTTNSAGTANKVRYSKILDLMCQMNKDYGKFDIRFYLSPHPTLGLFDESIKNDNVYENQTNATLMQNKRHFKALNVFVTNLAASGNTPPNGGTTLAYYNIPKDWVVSRKDQINGSANNGTLQHEIGHFFNLAHTFLGWEEGCFNSTFATWPIAPAISPGGVPTEKMDGSNCLVAADGICDTPPDYNFGYCNGGCSAYNGGAKDPMGVLVNPMENNFMGYFENCDYEFTDGQITEVKKNLNSSARNYLDNTFTPVAETVTSPTDLLVAPIANEVTPFYNYVDFDWKDVAGATYYVFEIDRLSSFSTADYQTFVVTENTQILTNLKKSVQYYWRVRPFNEYATCDAGKVTSFKTGVDTITAIPEIQAINDWKLMPNPVSSQSVLQIQVNASQNFEANIQITNTIGQVVFTKTGQDFSAGENLFSVENIKLAPGIYQVSLSSGDALMSKKLVIIN